MNGRRARVGVGGSRVRSIHGGRWSRAALAIALAAAAVCAGGEALAAPPRASAKVAAKPASRAHQGRAKARATQPTAQTPPQAAPATVPPATVPAVAAPAERAAVVPGRSSPAAAMPAAAPVIKTEEARAGERTYTFGAQEVEGRLKSPQILYFLRRVRAEFDPAPLGHRSFLLELYDTRRHRALE